MACASPVIWNMSPLSVLIVGVADCVIITTRFVTLLFVRVSVVALQTSVSVAVGSVIVPVLDIEEITGSVRVLLVRVVVSVSK